MLPFALNHMTAPKLGWESFADLAAGLGCVGVEYRNDLSGPLFGGADPAAVGAAVAGSRAARSRLRCCRRPSR